MYTIITKDSARRLRTEGYTHREIAHKLKISNGSAFLWTKGINVSFDQKIAIEERHKLKAHKWTLEEKRKARIRLRKYQFKIKFNKTDILRLIKEFHEKNGCIPLKYELNKFRICKKFFGSWNNAIVAAGFVPNPEKFTKRMLAKDGHWCDSFTEKIIDDWLYDRKIKHERNINYPSSKLNTDFYLPDHGLFIEYFGLKGANKKYDNNVKRKYDIVNHLKLNFLEITVFDITNNRFPELIEKKITKSSEVSPA
ncbi:MAG: hypothetical protein Q7S57_01625 [bacterium]|nr:hypothetical protein [bacterium]